MPRKHYCYYVVWSYGNTRNSATVVIDYKLNTMKGLELASRQIKLQYGVPLNHEIVIYPSDCMILKKVKLKK